MLILELAILWILVIPAAAVTGLCAAHRVLAGRANGRRMIAARRWAAAACEADLAHAPGRRPGHRPVSSRHAPVLSRR